MIAGRDIRMRVEDGPNTDYSVGTLHWSPVRSLWFSSMAMIGCVGAVLTLSRANVGIFLLTSMITLCGGHSLGMHRKLIHDSYDCPAWLERIGVWLACLVGLGGPYSMMYAHDVRDWAQRQPACHHFYSQHTGMLRDTFNQLHMTFTPVDPPNFHYPDRLTRDPWMRVLQRTSMLQSGVLAIPLYIWGGWGFVIWGVCLRVAVSMLGHSIVGWFAHNRGPQDWVKPGAGIQGHNVRFCGLISFGEAYHNNHHAFPECANYGHMPGQWDPGFWVLQQLERVGLVWNINATPELLHGDDPTVAIG